MVKVAAVVLAAGLSQRMGKQNKLLMSVGGKPMVRRTLEAFVARCDEVIVVTGYEANEVRDRISGLSLRVVHNPDYAKGQATSVAAGLKAALGAECILVGLGDQPLLTTTHLDALIAAHHDVDSTKISVPHNGRSRGNPIVIPGALAGQMLADKQNPGCGKFTRQRPDLVNLIQMNARAYFDDVDTPEDYAALTNAKLTEENMA